MSNLNILISVILALVPIAAVPRAIECIIRITTDPDQAGTYKMRLKNMLIFIIVAEGILQLLSLIYLGYLR